MDENVRNSLSITSAGVHLKRRRGRPKKNHGFTSGTYSPAPCKNGVDSNMLSQIESRSTAQNLNVGQPIDGVIEAVIDAGYVLKVEVSSGAVLRGVIFKPGHYVPFSYENDVAPNAQLIRRNNVSSPSGTQIPCCHTALGTKRRRRRQSKGNVNEAPVEHAVIAASPISTKCKFVPVVLPSSVSPSNLIPRSPAPHMITKQFSPFALKGPPFFNGSAPCHLNQRDTHYAAATTSSPGNLSTVPFQQLLDEVTRRTQSPLPTETRIHKMIFDLDEPLSVEPLQAIQPNHSENCTQDGKVMNIYQESVASMEKLQQNERRRRSFEKYDCSGGGGDGKEVSSRCYNRNFA